MHYWVNTRVEKKDRGQLKDTRNGAMFGNVRAGNSDKSTNQHCGVWWLLHITPWPNPVCGLIAGADGWRPPAQVPQDQVWEQKWSFCSC